MEQAPDGGGVRGSAHHNQAPATSALAQALRTPTRKLSASPAPATHPPRLTPVPCLQEGPAKRAEGRA